MFQVIFTLLFLGIAALFLWRGIVYGKRYTWIYSAVRAGSVILCVVLGVFLSAGLSKLIVDLVFGGLEKAGVFGSFRSLLTEIPSLSDTVCALVAMLLAPILFYVLFFVLRGIFGAVNTAVARAILRATEKKSRKENVLPVEEENYSDTETSADEGTLEEPMSAEEDIEEKILTEKTGEKVKKRDTLRFCGQVNPYGMVLGGVCGLLLFLAVMSPVIGMLGVMDDGVSTLAIVTDNKPIDIAANVTDGISNNAVSKTVRLCGGKAIYSGLTTYSVGDSKVTLPKETAFLRTAGQALRDYRNESLDRAAVAATLRKTADAFDETSLLPTVAPEFLSAANAQWTQGRTFHGIKKLSLGKNLQGINQPLLDLLATSDYRTIKCDTRTGLEILAKTVERGGLRDGLQGKALLKDETISKGIMYELLINTHTAPLVGDVLSYGFDEVGRTVGAHFDGDPVKDPTVTYASIDQIRVDSTKVQNMEQEAKVLGKILGRTLMLSESMEGDFTAALCIRDIGPILDLFAQSETVGEESTAIFLTCILQAEKVYDEIGFTLQEATDLAVTINGDVGSVNGDGTVNTYALMLSSVSNAVQVIDASSKQEEYHETMEALMADLTPASAKVLSQMMTTNVMTKHGVSGESAEPTSELISSIFTNLADEKQAGMPEDEYQRESQAVMNLTDLAMNSGKEGTNGAFGEGSATGVSADEFVDNILDSRVVSGSMKEQVFAENPDEPTLDPLKKGSKLSEKDANEMSQALTRRWQQEENKNDTETVKTYQAIGAMVGMKVKFVSGAVVLS